MKKISNQDLQYIEQQLGREPRSVIEISVRQKNGKPLVIKTNPQIDDTIFPTLYYLVDKVLIEKVSRLESEGLLAQLQEKVDNNSDFREKFLQAQEEYCNERNSLVDLPLRNSQKEALETGIGGVKDFTRIKCLHCHLAHYLASGKNPVGEDVYKIISPNPSLEKRGNPPFHKGR